MPAPDMKTPAKRRREIKMAPAELVRRQNQNTNDVRTREDSNLINAGSDAPPFFRIDRSILDNEKRERGREREKKKGKHPMQVPVLPNILLHIVHLRHRDSSDPSSPSPPSPPTSNPFRTKTGPGGTPST